VVVAGLAAPADAGGPGWQRPPVRLELAVCLDDERDAIERAVRVELGDPPVAEDPAPLVVAVDCAAGGADAGVVLEVRPPGSPRRYRYALDWQAQPSDARPRLVGLAVAEAVDASRIELTAVPEPPAALRRGTPAAVPPRAPSDWTAAVRGVRQAFSGDAGVTLVGVGLTPSRRLSSHLAVAIDITAGTATALAVDGAIVVQSVSSAPRIALRAGRRLYGELALGARVGIVRMRGEASPGSELVGGRLVRPWFGPAVDLAVGFELTSRIALRADLELGAVATGATARDLGTPIAAIAGTWTSLGLAAVLEL